MSVLVACSRFRKMGKALFVFKAQDDSMDPKIVDIMLEMKKELERRGISVTDDEKDNDCNMGIMFITKDFLDHRFDDIGKIRSRFTTFNCSIIICDDDKHEFVPFVKYSLFDSVHYGDAEDHARRIKGYPVAVVDVDYSLGTLARASKPKYRIIIPGDSPATADEIEKFAVDFADEAVQAFNPSRLDYNIINPAFESDMRDIYPRVLLESDKIFQDKSGDDLSFLVFAGCQCPCLDNTIMTKLILNLNYLTPFDTVDGRAIIKKEYYYTTCNDPFILQAAFMRANYGDNYELNGFRSYHLKCAYKRRHLVVIEDFEFYDFDHALLLLSNLTKFIGKGSLVIITTSSPTRLFDNKMDLMKLVRGTCCKNDFNSMLKCYTATKSKLLPPRETEDAHLSSYQDTLDKKYTEVNDLAEHESLPKKQKATPF